MPKEKLNLFKFSSRFMAETSTATTQVVRSKVVNTSNSGTLLHDVPNNVDGNAGFLTRPVLPNLPENLAFLHRGNSDPYIQKFLAPSWYRHGSHSTPFPLRSTMTQ